MWQKKKEEEEMAKEKLYGTSMFKDEKLFSSSRANSKLWVTS